MVRNADFGAPQYVPFLLFVIFGEECKSWISSLYRMFDEECGIWSSLLFTILQLRDTSASEIWCSDSGVDEDLDFLVDGSFSFAFRFRYTPLLGTFTVRVFKLISFVSIAGWIPSFHWSPAAVCQVFLLHVVQPSGGKTQVLQEARETHVTGRGKAVQGGVTGKWLLFSSV